MAVITENEDAAFRRYFWGILTILPGGIVAGLVLRYFGIFATDELLVAPALVGTILAVKAVYDGNTDPIFGWLSDRRKAPRRIPFFRWGGLGAFAVFGLFFPPQGLSGVALAVWLVFFMIIWETGQTMRGVAISALGLEVATDARRRTMIQTITAVPMFLGSLIGIAAMQYAINADAVQEALWPLLIGATIVWFVTIQIASSQMRELPKPHRTEERPPWHMVKEVISNRYHRQFITIHLAGTLAFVSLGFAIPYVTKYAFGREDMTIHVLVIFLGASALSTFLWLMVVSRLGVRLTWLAGKYVWLAVLLAYPLTMMMGIYAFLGLALIAGIGNGAGACTGYALLGDIADYDAKTSGRQRQGVYATLYGLVDKIGAAIGAFVLGWALQIAGFVPNQPQSETVLTAITVAVSIVPAVAIAISIRLLHPYRFYEEQNVWDGSKPRDVSMQPA